MANRQIHQLTADSAPATTFVLPVQIADGTVEAKKTTIAELKTAMSLNNVNNTSDANKPISTATAAALDLKSNLTKTVSSIAGDYTLVASDCDTIIEATGGGTQTITVPDGLGGGFTCTVVQNGVGLVVFAGSVATVNNWQGHTRIAGQYGVAFLHSVSDTEFLLSGETA